MKALFVITGIGLGHTMREEAIINEFKKRNKVMIAGFNVSYNYFMDKYKCFRIFGHKFYGNKPKTSNLRIFFENLLYPFYILLDTISLCFLILIYKIDVVVVDAEPCGLFAGKLTRRKTIVVYNIDLNKFISFRKKSKFSLGLLLTELIIRVGYGLADKVIVPVLNNKSKKIGREGNIFYVDAIVRVKPSKLEAKRELMRKLKFKREPILVTIGGSRFGVPLLKEVIKVAKRFDEDFVIFGCNFKNDENVRCYRFKRNFLEYLKISKAVIGSFGHSTLSEIFVYNKAALLFPIQGYVEHSLNLIEIKGYVKNANFYDINKKKLKTVIRDLLRERIILENKIKNLNLSGDGAKQAVKLISE